METGISIFVHKVAIDQLQHTLPAAPGCHRDRLPLAVSLLMTAWGKEASVGHDLLGWAMRVIADNPILTSASLNAAVSGAFANHETVELTPIDLSSDTIVRLWKVVLPNSLQFPCATWPAHCTSSRGYPSRGMPRTVVSSPGQPGTGPDDRSPVRSAYGDSLRGPVNQVLQHRLAPRRGGSRAANPGHPYVASKRRGNHPEAATGRSRRNRQPAGLVPVGAVHDSRRPRCR